MTFAQVELAAYRAAGQQPVAIIPRNRTEEWLVAAQPVVFDAPLPWQRVCDGQGVYIPLIPYRLVADANGALAYIFALGLRAGLGIQRTHADPRRIHVVTGDTADDLTTEGHPGSIRFYAGLAIQLR